MKRRSFIGMLVAAGGAVVAGIVGIPTLMSGLSPAIRGRRGEVWRAIGRLEDFPVGTIREAQFAMDRSGWPRSFRRHAVYIARQLDESVVVFSRACTDLGCPLDYDAGSACFFCPCHGGIFGRDGQRLAGPPDRPMDRYDLRIRDGVVEIDLASVPVGV